MAKKNVAAQSPHQSMTKLPSIPVALRILAKMRNEIRNVDSFVKLDRLANRAAGMQLAFKDVEIIANEAGEALTDAEIKLHHEWAREEKAKGGQPHHKKSTGLKNSPVGVTIKALKLDKNRLTRAKKLAEITARERAALTKKLKDTSKLVNPTTLLAAKRKEAKEAKRHNMATAAFNADGPFDVVVVDWPWPMEKRDREVRPNQAAFDYPRMTLDEMRKFWTEEMESKSRLNPDCHVFFWTTQDFLKSGEFSFLFSRS